MSPRKAKKRKTSAHEKRRLILNAAVRVFAQKGFHRCRISDIANEAGVAYGLVYHYFEHKEAILNTIFDENWGLFTKVLETLKEQPDPLEKKLLAVVSMALDAYKLFPDIIQVIVMEIARSSKLLKKPKIEAFERSFHLLADILEAHKKSGEVRTDINTRILAYSLFGSIELIFTAYILGSLSPGDDDSYQALKEYLVKIIMDGIRPKQTL